MKFASTFDEAKEQVIQHHPKLEKAVFEFHNTGWENLAVIADNEMVFRFPRKVSAYEAIWKEYTVLNELKSKLPAGIQIPVYEQTYLSGDFPYVAYKAINGRFLTKQVFDSLTENEKDSLSANMAKFLSELHSLDYKKLDFEAELSIAKYRAWFWKIQVYVFKFLTDEEKEKVQKWFDAFFSDETMHNFKSVLVHADLSEDHIIITNDGGIGIIDFGDLMAFDPAHDFIWAYKLDKEFYKDILSRYNGPKDDYFEHRIRDFNLFRPPFEKIMHSEKHGLDGMREEGLNELRKLLEGLQ